MTCEELVRGETLEHYVAGQLDEAAMAGVERHVFECESCAARLDDLMVVRTILAEPGQEGTLALPPRRRATGWYGQPLAIAAAIACLMFAAAGAVWWTRGTPVPTQARAPRPAVAPTDAPASASSAPAAIEPLASAPASTPGAPHAAPAAPAEADWARLARFEAPALLALTLRGAGEAEGGDTALDGARRAYAEGRYAEAAEAFSRGVSGGEVPAEVAFYRGVSRLKSGALEAGLADLQAAVASGQVPYAVEAHLYLAHGRLAQRDLEGARAALERYVALDGDFTTEARRLARQLPRSAPPPR